MVSNSSNNGNPFGDALAQKARQAGALANLVYSPADPVATGAAYSTTAFLNDSPTALATLGADPLSQAYAQAIAALQQSLPSFSMPAAQPNAAHDDATDPAALQHAIDANLAQVDLQLRSVPLASTHDREELAALRHQIAQATSVAAANSFCSEALAFLTSAKGDEFGRVEDTLDSVAELNEQIHILQAKLEESEKEIRQSLVRNFGEDSKEVKNYDAAVADRDKKPLGSPEWGNANKIVNDQLASAVKESGDKRFAAQVEVHHEIGNVITDAINIQKTKTDQTSGTPSSLTMSDVQKIKEKVADISQKQEETSALDSVLASVSPAPPTIDKQLSDAKLSKAIIHDTYTPLSAASAVAPTLVANNQKSDNQAVILGS